MTFSHDPRCADARSHRSLLAPGEASRRRFLRQAAALSAYGAAPFALNLASIGAASAQSADDFRALVCVFLFGGNDQSNTIIPYDAPGYAAYQSARPTLAIARDQLAATRVAPAGISGREFALHPALAPLKTLFDQGRLAVLPNVGPLRYPLTRAQYQARSVPLPPQLFSHSDHQILWQTSQPDFPTATGWGGRLGDLLASQNGNSPLSVSLSIAGNNLFQTGNQTVQLQVGTDGLPRLWATEWPYGNGVAGERLRALLAENRAHVMERHLNTVMQRGIAAELATRNALAAATPIATAFASGNPLAAQLRMVARLISIRQQLGLRRQIYFVSLGGWDHHENLIEDHNTKLGQLASAMSSFYQATVELGVADKVTSFTASDFGRALQHNGRGSDHGWGGHHFVMGNAVRGGAFYGTFPSTALNGPEDAGQGRLIPSTSVDQYAATLASWMGVSGSNLNSVLPNIARFNSPNLGFMA